jgi:hypothetical protein
MHSWMRRVVAVATAILFAVVAGEATAQGVTSSSIAGRITQEGGQPIDGANVTVINTLTGQRFQVVTRAGGRYNIENLPPGGPYTLEIRAIGFQANRKTGVRLELGQRYSSDFSLATQVVEVQELVVTGGENALINRGRTGSGSTISDSAIANLPLLGRNFTDLIVTSPSVVATPNGGPSIGGSNNRFNNIQLDGSANNDLFGLGSTGAPGGQTSGKAVALDAVSEFQVLVAPFDVRQSGFTGGLVNAVTKSGTNDLRGSAFLFYQNQELVGLSSLDNSVATDFTVTQFGGSVGGPIIRDRAHFFASLDVQGRNFPYGGVLLDLDNVAVSDSVQDFRDHVIASGGSDPGSAGGFDFTNPNFNLLTKFTAQAGANGYVEFSNSYASSENQTISRSLSGAYQLYNGGYEIRNNNNTMRFKWTNVFGGRFNNEFFAGYSRIRDRRDPFSRHATVIVDYGPYDLVSGAERFSHDNELDQDIWEIKDNVTWDVGTHRLTVGTDNQFFGFRNAFFPQSLGQWTFSSLANFQAGIASRFDRAMPAAGFVPGGRADPTARFDVRQWGLFAQDRFSPLPNLTLTVGIRADIPTFPSTPPSNPTFKALDWVFDGQNLDTGIFPSGNVLWAPRFGFNYDHRGQGDLILRGGVGVFSGRPPYVWLSNAFGNSGLEQVQLTCTGGNVPNFNLFGLDGDQPTSCGAGPTQPLPTLNLFTENFKFPQSLRVNLGADKRLPLGMVATVDLLFANSMSSLMIEDRNLGPIQGTLDGEGGRALYGNPNVVSPAPVRLTPAFGPVLVHYNRGNEYSYSGTFQLQRRFANGYEFNLGYTHGRAYDLMSQTSSIAFSNYGFSTLDGTLGDRQLRTSVFDRPHKITMSGTVALPYRIDFSLIYIGVSGTPYAYVVNGDINADGVGGTNREFNDLFYVPLDASDITMLPTAGDGGAAEFAALDEYIEDEPCLREQRGKIMERNSCRNPWANFLNARLTWNVPTTRGQRFEVSAEMFNLLNWMSSDWGLVKQTSAFEGTAVVRRVNTGTAAERFDAANDRHIYDFIGNVDNLRRIQTTDSRWRMQLGARYTF